MPLDPSIPLAAKGPRIEYNPINPINAMLQGEQLRGAQQANALRQLQMQQSQREMEQKEVLNRLLVGAMSPEGDLDYGKAMSALAGAGMGEQLPELAERRDRTRLKQAQIAAAQAEQQRKAIGEAIGFLNRADEQNYPAVRQFMVQMAPGLEGLLPTTYNKSSIDALAGRMQEQVKVLTGSPGAQFLRQNPQTGQMEVMHTVPFKPAEPAAPQRPMVLGPSSIAVDPTTGQVVARGPRAESAPAAPSAPRTQRVELNDGSIGLMNMDTGQITRATMGGEPAKARPSAFAEKTQSQRAQLARDLDTAISELKDAVKPKGLIDQSTGSGAGRLVDVGARFIGQANKGDIAIGKLAPISDLVLKMVPRFEGPQSDKDTKSYKEAAGQLADATLPRDIRKQAALTIIRLMENRKEQFVTKDMADSGAPPAAPKGASGEWTVMR